MAEKAKKEEKMDKNSSPFSRGKIFFESKKEMKLKQ